MADRSRRLEPVTAEGVEIMTCVEGEGPTLVMLPSYGRDGLGDFDRVAGRAAADGWRVLRPQPRGVAGSTGPMEGVGLKDLAGDVARVVERYGGGPAVVLGHAFGSFVARVLAVERPDLVRGVVLAAASAAPGKVPHEVEETPFVVGDPDRPGEERLAALRLGFFAPGHDPRPWLDGWYPAALALQRGAVKATRLDSYWSCGAAPVLEVNARHDPFKPRALWSELRDAVGERVTTIVIEDASHALFPEQPDRVAQVMRQWIAAL